VNLAFLLHIYQPPNQDGKIVKEIAESSYLPLIKSIKRNQNINITLNIPLSLTHQLHKNGYDKFIKDLKDLYEAGRVELTSTGAYHPLLTKIPPQLAEKEIILNEYGLGYHFGKDKGFEGEEAILIKNVNGIFPPEMAVNDSLLELLDKMGYSWVAVDEAAIPSKELEYNPVYNFKDLNIKAVCRHTGLSNILSFKRDTDIDDFIDYTLMLRQKGTDLVVALDGEFFGHHHKEGIYVFETLVNILVSLGVNLTTVSELVSKVDEITIDGLRDSTWGADEEKMQSGNAYPLWDNPEIPLHKLLWEVLNKVAESASEESVGVRGDSHLNGDEIFDYKTFPIWDLEKLEEIKNINLKNHLYENILLLQSLNSDQFWWASNIKVGEKEMFDSEYIKKSLEVYLKYATVTQNEDLIKFIQQKSIEITKELASMA